VAPEVTNADNVHAAIAELARQLHASERQDLNTVLINVADGAVRNVPGAEYAGITVTTNRDTLTTQVATDPIAELHNDIQVKHGQGPCLEAAWEQPVVRVNDLTSENRWPAYAPDAVALTPFRSLMSFRLYTRSETLGSLTLYSRVPHAFTDESEEIGLVYAAHAALAWAATERGSQFQSALASRDIIGQAKGMIMERFDIDAVQAFELIRKLSQDTNTPLAKLAADLVHKDHPPKQ
jgi:GAF domain-containing protein